MVVDLIYKNSMHKWDTKNPYYFIFGVECHELNQSKMFSLNLIKRITLVFLINKIYFHCIHTSTKVLGKLYEIFFAIFSFLSINHRIDFNVVVSTVFGAVFCYSVWSLCRLFKFHLYENRDAHIMRTVLSSCTG